MGISESSQSSLTTIYPHYHGKASTALSVLALSTGVAIVQNAKYLNSVAWTAVGGYAVWLGSYIQFNKEGVSEVIQSDPLGGVNKVAAASAVAAVYGVSEVLENYLPDSGHYTIDSAACLMHWAVATCSGEKWVPKDHHC